MKLRKKLLPVMLSLALVFNALMPAAAAEAPFGSGQDQEIRQEGPAEAAEVNPNGEELQDTETEGGPEEAAEAASDGKDERQEEAAGSEDPEESQEAAEIPEERTAPSATDSSGTSSWLSDYDYIVSDGAVTLTAYKGSETDVTVPGTAYINNTIYRKIYLTSRMWGSSVAGLSFEKGVALPADSSGMFAAPYTKSSGLVYFDGTNLDTSSVTDMSSMFYDCRKLEYADLSSFDTSSVTDMSNMFEYCFSLESVNLSSFNTTHVTDMSGMFHECSSLTALDVSMFDTSAAADMRAMFFYCSGLTALDVSGFDTSSVTRMNSMFTGCSGLTSLDVSGFNTSQVTVMDSMFGSCSGLTSLDLSSFNTSQVTDMGLMFSGCSGLTHLDLSCFNTSHVRDMSFMFNSCSGLTSLDVSSFDTSSVVTMTCMFNSCSGLTSLDITHFNTSSVRYMSSMFNGCSSLKNLDLGSFRTSAAEEMDRMFYGCSSLTTLDLSSFNTSHATAMNSMFHGCSSLTDLIINSFDTSSLTDMRDMFSECRELTSLDLSSFDTSNVTRMDDMFSRCVSLTELDLSSFDMSNVGTAANMLSFRSVAKNMEIRTPKNVEIEIDLPTFDDVYDINDVLIAEGGVLYDQGGNSHSKLPMNSPSSMLLVKNGKVSFLTQPEDVQAVSGEEMTFTADIDGAFAYGIWQYRDADGTGWTDYRRGTKKEELRMLTIQASSEWNGRSLRLVLYDAWDQTHFSREAAITVGEVQEEGSVEKISYSFFNSASSFGYPSGYRIPLSSYQIIYGDNTRAEAVYAAHSRNAWEGSCAGLAATSALMTTAGSGVWPYTFKTGASLPRDLSVSDRSASLGMDLTTFVEAMHIAQYTEAFSKERKAHVVYTSAIQAGSKNLDELYNAVNSKAEAGIPTVLALVQAGGHAVLAYKTEEVSGSESRIYIYDSNFPLLDRYITFYKNGGHYTQWSYDMGSYGEWGTDSSSSSISYIAYATIKSIWDNRGKVGQQEASLAFVNSRNFAVYDVKGSLEAIVSEGSLSDRTGKISLIEDELSLTGPLTRDVILSLPTKTHTIVNLDRTISSFAVTVVDTDLGISVDTTVQEVTLSVDDEYSISSLSMEAETGDTYSVTLSSSFASGYDKVEVSGTGQGETLSISQSGTDLNFSNCDISLLMVDGQQVGVCGLTASVTAGGSISPAGTTSVRSGESLTYTIVPDAGYTIQDIFVDGISVGAVSSYTFTKVSTGHTILATFKKAPVTLETPKVTSVTNVKNGVKIAWGKVEGAENYRIYVKANGGGWKRLTETAGTSYTWTGAESGNTYGFTIRCMNAAATSFTSGYDNTGKSVTYIAAPSITKLESLAGGVKITWTKSAGAQLYRIYYREGSGSWKKLTDTTSTSYTWSGAEGGKTYGFTLRCMNSAGTSFTSGYDDVGKSITYKKPAANPEVTSLSAVTGGLKIDWSSYQGAGVYAVYYKTGTGAGGWKKLVNVSGTSYTWTGAVDGTTYSFTVRAMNDAGTSFVSGYNNTGMSIAYKAVAAIPRVTSVTNVQGGVKIAWSAFTGAGSYRIFYKESGGSWKKLCDASGTSYTWTGAVSGSFYAFTVRALNAAGTSYVSGYDNTGKAVTYVAAPVITTLKKVSGGIQITWGTCAGAGSYRIFVKVNGGGWKKLTDVSGTTYTWKGAAAGNTYGFTVRCMNAGSTSFVSGYDNTGRNIDF